MSEKRSIRTVDALATVEASFVVRTTLCCAVEGLEVIGKGTLTDVGLIEVVISQKLGTSDLLRRSKYCFGAQIYNSNI